MENRSNEKEAASRPDSGQLQPVKAFKVNQHDWPPPVVVSDGSLVIEMDMDFSESSSGSLWLYERPEEDRKIDHIRILHGCGLMLYQDLYPDPASSIVVTVKNVHNSQTDDLTIKGGGVFRISSNKKLNRVNTHGAKRSKSLHHPGPDGTHFRIESIEVRDSSNQIRFKTTRWEDSDAPSEEYRVLIWLET